MRTRSGLQSASTALRKRSSTHAAVTPATRITLLRLLCPAAIVTDERGTFKSSAKNATHASFARPSIGGAVSATFSASPTSPTMAFFFARGCTLTDKVAPVGVSRTVIICSFSLRRRHCMADRHSTSPATEMVRGIANQTQELPHAFARSPKIAVPTRTQVDPSSIATSKSCDMPMESWSNFTEGRFLPARLSRNSRSFRK